jgi:glutamyl-tRNA synthetase
MKPVRTRFAPSPTGALHAGAVRTALFAWLIAKQGKGKFILRIEDTDQAREVEGAVKNIVDSLHYIGIDWDEGPGKDGEYGPYMQSLRLETYKPWAEKLIEQGRAYADPFTQEEVEAFRQKTKEDKKPFFYRDHRPENPPVWDGSMPLRFKSDPKPYSWDDAVMGKLNSSPEAVDDFVLIKSDGFPTYNFAHIIDDEMMKISHVIRSQEFVSSVPRYLNLYEALGLEVPILATVPSVLRDDGKKKLGKRDGAKQLLDYKAQGILPEAMVNFLATIGWNDGTEQEIFSVPELIKKFDLSRVQKSGARFDEQRLIWLNGHYIRELSEDKLFELGSSYLPPEADSYDDNYKKRVLSLIQERLKFFSELPELTNFFFKDLPVDLSLIEKNPKLGSIEKTKLVEYLNQARISLADSDYAVDDLQARLNNLLKATEQSPAILFSLIRIATTQAPSSPGLADTLSVLGKEVSLRRLDQSIASLA